MSDLLTIRVDTRELERALDGLNLDISDGRVPMRRFYQWFRIDRLRAWTVRAVGGDFLGKRWRALRSQYFRRTDSVTVPAWGGVPRIREGFKKAARWHSDVATKKTIRRGVSTGKRMEKVSGTVSGRLRRSGNRVQETSIILRDTGEFARQLLPPKQPPILTPSMMQIGGDLPDWRIEQLKTWPVLFWLATDERMFQSIGNEFVVERIKARGLNRAA